MAARRPGPDDEPEAFDEAVEHTRGRGSGWRVAGLAVAFLLVLIMLSGAVRWLRDSQRPAARVPASTAPVVAPERLVASQPAREQRAPPPQSEAAVPALPVRPTDTTARSVAPPVVATPALPPRPRVSAESPSASPHTLRPGVEVSDVRIEIATERRPGGVTDYSVRLRERDGTPVSGAAVSMRGRRADGVLVEASLDPAPEPGMYRASLRLAEIRDARLRVAREDRVEDVRLPE